MPTQAVGRKTVHNVYDESAYGVVPGSPVGERLYLKSHNIAATVAKLTDDTLSSYRGKAQPVNGNTDVAGSIAFVLAPQSCPKYLKHLFGYVNTDYACAQRATSNISGVEILRATAASAAGTGVLTWTASGTTLKWHESGDTDGSTVNVSAGGDFTISSANGKSLYVRVTAGSLPVGNQTDNVTVSASSAHSIVFSPRGTRPEGLLLEQDDPDIATGYRWQRYLGIKIGAAKFSFKPSGFVDVSVDAKGASYSNSAGAVLDASIDDYGHTAFSMFSATIEEGGATIADVTSVEVNYSNDVDDSNFVIGAGGIRGSLPDGFWDVTGSLEQLYKAATLLNKAIAGTSSTLKITLYNGTADGTAGNEALIFRFPSLVYEVKSVGTDGPKGKRQTLNFMTYRPTAAESQVEVELRSTRAVSTI